MSAHGVRLARLHHAEGGLPSLTSGHLHVLRIPTLGFVDVAIVEKVAAAGCPFCGGVLHRGDYPRKARWGGFVEISGALARRFSLCCSREGCRKRATPPSVRFLGRRVYLGVAVLVASLLALASLTASEAVRASAVPAQTLRRWLRWWSGPFTETDVFMEIRAHLVPPPRVAGLPHSLISRMTGVDMAARIASALRLLAPLTTTRSRTAHVL